MRSKRHARFPFVIFVVLAGCSAAQAEEPVLQHYVLMRSFAVDSGPRTAIANVSAGGELIYPVQACDGQTYYLTVADAAAVRDALEEGATVQLHKGPAGTVPADAAIVCLFE